MAKSKQNTAADKELQFSKIIGICSDATGGNAAFDPRETLSYLNDIRSVLGLPSISQKEMMQILHYY